MENQAVEVEKLYEGASPSELAGEALPVSEKLDTGDDIATAVATVETSGEEPKPEEPTPAQPPKQLTERERKELLRKFFTVRHERLTNCGHKFVPDLQPKNNCENCWWTFFNTHKELVELTDKVWADLGKQSLVGMRGGKYVKMFGRFMATLIRLKQEEEALRIKNGNQDSSEPGSTVGEVGNETDSVSDPLGSVNEGGEAEGSDFSIELPE